MRPATPSPDPVTERADGQPSILCGECGNPRRPRSRFCSPRCFDAAYNRANPVARQVARQRALPLEPPVAPVPQVQDQRVPVAERAQLRLMARLILQRVERGPATASELHAMFPGARSVRTRISEVGRHVGSAWRSAPVKGVVGEWVYWIEGRP